MPGPEGAVDAEKGARFLFHSFSSPFSCIQCFLCQASPCPRSAQNISYDFMWAMLCHVSRPTASCSRREEGWGPSKGFELSCLRSLLKAPCHVQQPTFSGGSPKEARPSCWDDQRAAGSSSNIVILRPSANLTSLRFWMIPGSLEFGIALV